MSGFRRFTFHERLGVVLLVGFVIVGFAACDRTLDQASEARKGVVADRPGVFHLTSEELARTEKESRDVLAYVRTLAK